MKCFSWYLSIPTVVRSFKVLESEAANWSLKNSCLFCFGNIVINGLLFFNKFYLVTFFFGTRMRMLDWIVIYKVKLFSYE